VRNPVTDRISGPNLDDASFVIVGLFIGVWADAIAYWRIAKGRALLQDSHDGLTWGFVRSSTPLCENR
jgi:hypothetical protein